MHTHAMCCTAPGQALAWSSVTLPALAADAVLVRVGACGVCRTDLHVVDGELPDPLPHVIPGHEIVGVVAAIGDRVEHVSVGDRVGVPWLGFTCGHCEQCRAGRENLCDNARFHGYTLQGGYAEYVVANAHYCFQLPERYSNIEAAPLLCAGLIGYRSLRMAGDAPRLGIYGFGAAAHIVTQVARYQGRQVYAFSRPGDVAAQGFARELGAIWAGDSTMASPDPLDAAILYAPVGELVPQALSQVRKGGIVVCAGIHMSDIPRFPYDLLWGERRLCSVANLTRADGEAFMALAAELPIQVRAVPYPLREANRALADLRAGRLTGAAVLVVD